MYDVLNYIDIPTFCIMTDFPPWREVKFYTLLYIQRFYTHPEVGITTVAEQVCKKSNAQIHDQSELIR